MAVRNPVIWNGMYCGTYAMEHRQSILQLREEKKVDALKKMVFNFPSDLIEKADEEKISVREYALSNGLNLLDYLGELRDYQTVGTAFLYMSPRSILGDGVGLGKTAEISALFNYLRKKNEMGRFLMAVETSAVGQTVQEIKKFTGLYAVELPSDKAKMLRVIKKTDWTKVDGIVVRHSALSSDTFSTWLSGNIREDNTFNLFDTFVLDESSLIKNVKTKVYTYTRNICELAKRVHFLNATVFETNIMDIYYQMDMMNTRVLPTKTAISETYCVFKSKDIYKKGGGKQIVRDLTGYKNQGEFKNSLKLFYFGRSIKDTGIERNNEYLVYTVEPTTAQMFAIKGGNRYNEILNCPTLVPDCGINFEREECPKLDRLLNLCEKEFTDSSIMVYCFYKDAQAKLREELEKIGRKVCTLNGETKDDDRKQVINDFNAGVYDVIITNIKKSLNLYNGDVCIFYTVEGNPAKMEQIRGRIDRNVDDKKKTFVLLLYSHTLEYMLFTKTAHTRSKDSKDLTIDFTSAVDYFMDSMNESEG